MPVEKVVEKIVIKVPVCPPCSFLPARVPLCPTVCASSCDRPPLPRLSGPPAFRGHGCLLAQARLRGNGRSVTRHADGGCSEML